MPEQLSTFEDAEIRARVTSLGTLNTDSLQVFYATDESGPWQTLTFAALGNDSFAVTLPPHPFDVPVYYYARAKNEEGNWTSMPRYGPEAHYVTQFPQVPAAVSDLAIHRSGDDMVLNWSQVTDTFGFPIANASYRIYASDAPENIVSPPNLISTTTETSFTLINGVNDFERRFFQIVVEVP